MGGMGEFGRRMAREFNDRRDRARESFGFPHGLERHLLVLEMVARHVRELPDEHPQLRALAAMQRGIGRRRARDDVNPRWRMSTRQVQYVARLGFGGPPPPSGMNLSDMPLPTAESVLGDLVSIGVEELTQAYLEATANVPALERRVEHAEEQARVAQEGAAASEERRQREVAELAERIGEGERALQASERVRETLLETLGREIPELSEDPPRVSRDRQTIEYAIQRRETKDGEAFEVLWRDEGGTKRRRTHRSLEAAREHRAELVGAGLLTDPDLKAAA